MADPTSVKPSTQESTDPAPVANVTLGVNTATANEAAGVCSVAQAISALRGHPERVAISARVFAVTRAAWSENKPSYLTGTEVPELSTNAPLLTQEAAETTMGNAAQVLDQGASEESEWLLLSVAAALEAEALWRQQPEQQAQLIQQLAWLDSSTPCVSLSALGKALPGAELEPYSSALIAKLSGGTERSERLVALLAVLELRSSNGAELQQALGLLGDPAFSQLAARQLAPAELHGELEPAIRGPIITAVGALTGWLLLRSCLNIALRTLFGLRRNAALAITPQGIDIRHELSLFGRTVRAGRIFVPIAELKSLERQTRYQGATFYAGLLALVIGTFVGVGWFLDGVLVPGGSPSLLAAGLAAIALGVSLDFILTHVSTYKEGRVRLLLRRARGAGLSVARLRADEAERALNQVVTLPGFQSPGV